jgi:hypothetical protein
VLVIAVRGFLVSLAAIVAVVAFVACGNPHDLPAGEPCYPDGPNSPRDPCVAGTACLAGQSGVVCTAATACKVDSDCPGHFACTLDDWTDSTRMYCGTTCKSQCAAGYGCAADGVACELRLGLSCYVTDTQGEGCGTGAVCSAVTRVCSLPPQCNDDSDCGGFACYGHTCMLSCTPAVTTGAHPTNDVGCAPGFACNPQTFTCSSSLGGACDPASDDGKQCGVGGACSPLSHTCVPATPCGSDDECSGYGCFDDYCLLACTKNVLPCAVGRTCNLDAHTCS